MNNAASSTARLPRFNGYLGEALEFSEDDLTANRAGTVTPAQKERLRGLETKNVLQMLFFSLLMLALAVVFNNVNTNAEEGSALMVILMLVVGMTGAALLLRTLLVLWRWQKHAGQLRAVPITGPIRLTEFGAKVTEHYRSLETKFFLHTGRQHFMIPYEAFAQLTDGKDYTVYYEPTTGHLLSVE